MPSCIPAEKSLDVNTIVAAKFCQLWLTCKDKEEAAKIGRSLLDKKLIACYGVLSSFKGEFWWEGKIKKADEALLELLTRLDLFDEIEREVAKLHSYDTFVLEAVSVTRISKKAEQWLKSELKNV